MTTLYKKIDTKFNNIDFSELIGQVNFKYKDSFSESRILKSCSEMIELLSDKIKFSISPDQVSMTEVKYPGMTIHTDTWNVSLNYYLSIANGSTTFYKLKEGSTDIIAPRSTYNIDNFIFLDKFNPNKNDLYLFNSSVPHSISVPLSEENRQLFRFIWNDPSINIDDIYNSIELIK
jgi:hypothetical protein